MVAAGVAGVVAVEHMLFAVAVGVRSSDYIVGIVVVAAEVVVFAEVEVERTEGAAEEADTHQVGVCSPRVTIRAEYFECRTDTRIEALRCPNKWEQRPDSGYLVAGKRMYTILSMQADRLK